MVEPFLKYFESQFIAYWGSEESSSTKKSKRVKVKEKWKSLLSLR